MSRIPKSSQVRASLVGAGLVGISLAACRSQESAPQKVEADKPAPVVEAVAAQAMESELVRIGEILWYTNYEVALEAARSRDLPLWVHFGEHPG